MIASPVLPPKSWATPEAHFMEVLSHPWYQTVNRLLSQVVLSTHDFYKDESFSPAMVPITTGSISSPMGLGSDSTPVVISLFGSETYLADSMQFLLEYLLRHDAKGVFYIMPSFRGENPDSKHLNQFFHSEAEMKGNLNDVIWLVERYLRRCTQDIIENLADMVIPIAGGTEHLQRFLKNDSIPRIEFSECWNLLNQNQNCFRYLDGNAIALSDSGERKLVNKFQEGVWVTQFPRVGVPFYQATSADGRHALCADLLIGIGETVGAGQRSVSSEETLKELKFRKISASDYTWYLKMKELFPIQTSGFGMGIERFLLWILQHNDIRDIQILPRMKDIPSIF